MEDFPSPAVQPEINGPENRDQTEDLTPAFEALFALCAFPETAEMEGLRSGEHLPEKYVEEVVTFRALGKVIVEAHPPLSDDYLQAQFGLNVLTAGLKYAQGRHDEVLGDILDILMDPDIDAEALGQLSALQTALEAAGIEAPDQLY